MERSSVTRYLRYTVTALSLTACVLLIALWVRSYSWYDVVYFRILQANRFVANSSHGQVSSGFFQLSPNEPGFEVISVNLPSEPRVAKLLASERTTSGFSMNPIQGSWGIAVPYYFAVLMACVVALLPWTHRFKRFSLRTLLIATTLVAVVLGAIVYASR